MKLFTTNKSGRLIFNTIDKKTLKLNFLKEKFEMAAS